MRKIEERVTLLAQAGHFKKMKDDLQKDVEELLRLEEINKPMVAIAENTLSPNTSQLLVQAPQSIDPEAPSISVSIQALSNNTPTGSKTPSKRSLSLISPSARKLSGFLNASVEDCKSSMSRSMVASGKNPEQLLESAGAGSPQVQNEGVAFSILNEVYFLIVIMFMTVFKGGIRWSVSRRESFC